MAICTTCTSSTTLELTPAQRRENSLAHYYAAERRAGADPLTAHERMVEHAKRLDAEAGE